MPYVGEVHCQLPAAWWEPTQRKRLSSLPGRLGLEPCSSAPQFVHECVEQLGIAPQDPEDRHQDGQSVPAPSLSPGLIHCPLESVCLARLWCLTWPAFPLCGRRSQRPALCGRNHIGCGLSQQSQEEPHPLLLTSVRHGNP